MWKAFWSWYERKYAFNLGVATGLFLLQVIHLIWLSLSVVWPRLFGVTPFEFSDLTEKVLVLVDYTEIPALISVSLVYINELRNKFNWKSVVYLVFLNSQWLHIFWITDEFVELSFNSTGTILPLSLVALAIAIDYLELPVMLDTLKRFFLSLRLKPLDEAMREFKEE